MAPRARQYEAFISYSHAADSPLSAQLQKTLNRIARPSYKWWEWWPPRVFRDETNLTPVGDLTGEIRRALAASDSLVLLASPRAAASRWVGEEVQTWRDTKSPGRLFIALTEGTLEWDDARSDFDPARTTALPPALHGAFDAEPLWVDFSAVREDRPFARDPLFLDGAATLAAAIRRVDKDGLIGDDVRQRRRARQLAVGAVATVTLLAIAATIAAVFALVQRDRANERARLALSRQYAAESVRELDVDPERSVALAARAATTAPTDEADSALRRALRTSRLRRVVGTGASVNDVEVAAEAPVVAAALGNGLIRVWGSGTDSRARTFRVGGRTLAVGLSRDGARVLGASDAHAVVWQTAGGEPARFATSGRIICAALSPDGTTAATGHHDGVVRLWRVETGRLERELRPRGRAAPVTAVAFATDGLRIAAAAGTNAAVWDVRRPSPTLVRPHESDVSAVAFSPDGLALATGDDEGVVRLWNVRTPRATVLIGHEGRVTSVGFAPDGRTLVTGGDDETARIWDVRSGRATAELRGHDGLVLGVAFVDSNTIATGGADRAIRYWAVDADPVRIVLDAQNGRAVKDVAFDPEGERLATAGEDRRVRVWELPSGRPLYSAVHGAEDDDWVESVRFDARGGLVVSAGDDGVVRIWDAATGEPQATFGRPGDPEVFDVAISPDSELVLAGARGGAAKLWRRVDGKLLAQLRTPADRVDGVAFSPDGRLLALGAGRAVRVWRAGSFGAPAIVLRDPTATEQNQVTSVAISPDGTLVAAGNGTGAWSIWDVRTRELVRRVKGHTDTVADVAFSPNGAYLATAGWDGAARVWAVPGGGLVTARRTASPELEAVAFARRGRLVAVAGLGGRTTVFECAECRPLDELVCVAARRVTPEVRAREDAAFRECD